MHIDISGVLKQSGSRRHQEPMIFKVFAPDKILCIVSVLMEYIRRTDSVRHAEANKLFVLHRKPHTNASKGTLARWTRDVLTSAGIATKKYGPRSVRSASASAAKVWRVSLEAVMKAAGWSQESTFRKCYRNAIDRSGRYSQIIQERCQSNSETPEYTNTILHK